MRWRHATDGGTSTWQCTLAPSTPEAVTVLLDPYSIPKPRRVRAAVRPNPSRTTPRYCRSRTPSDVSALAHTAHSILYTHSAWHIRPVAAPGFGPRRTADNTARTIRHIAASAAPSSLSATRTRCGTRHESSAYTSGAFPSPATAPHAFVAASTRHRATSPRHRATSPRHRATSPPRRLPSSPVSALYRLRAVMFPVVACGRSPRSRLTWTRQRERRPRRRPRRLRMQERRHRYRPARPS